MSDTPGIAAALKEALGAAETDNSRIMIALGAASMCWSETPSGVFLSDLAIQIGRALYDALDLENPS